MADKNGRTGNDIIEAVLKNASRSDFFRIIRCLELMLPGGIPIGKNGPPSDEIVSIRPEASFRFAPGAIASVETDHKRKSPLVMIITFFGLYGRYGTLPWHYTSRIIHQEKPSIADTRYPDSGLRAFLDLFNHRFASLFYRAGVKYRWPLTFRTHGDDETTGNFVAFTGLKTFHTRNMLCIPDIALLRYAGLFTIPNSASSLTTLLSDFFNVPVQIRQFEGEWLETEESDQNTIGHRKANNCLGRSFTIGRRIFSRQHRFRIIIGPLKFDQFILYQPGQKKFRELLTLVRMRAGVSMKFDLALNVDRQSVPLAALGKNKVRLGRTFFLQSPHKQGPISWPTFKVETDITHPDTFETKETETEGSIAYV